MSDKDEVVGGVSVSSSGDVEFRVPLRLILASGVSFPTSSKWNKDSLQKTINDFGADNGGVRWRDVRVVQAHVPAGCYFPRIARPSTDHIKDPPTAYGLSEEDKIECKQALGSFKSILSQFDVVTQSIHPSPDNLNAYGPKTRNLMILAATEFEATAKGVLRKNKYKKKETAIFDYQKLEKAMQLSGYKVRLRDFPEINPIRPFADWGENSNLDWYKAYNATKHDRYAKFSEANLANAIDAITGCFVLLVASYGWNEILDSAHSFAIDLEITSFPDWDVGHLYRRAKKQNGGQYELMSINSPIEYLF
ncbi:MAG: hypothetical protein ACSHXB_01980 [Sulfitobacter sp.]